jgi:hypothetical protein
METAKRLEGIEIPKVTTEFKTEKEVEEKIEEMKKALEEELEKVLNSSFDNISPENLQNLKNDFFSNEYFEKIKHIEDKKLWREIHDQWFNLNQEFLELQLKLLHTGCDEYDMEYTMQSEFYQLFHEDPDKRRARIEGPINRKIERNEQESQLLDEKIKELESYSINTKTDLIYENLKKIGINLAS